MSEYVTLECKHCGNTERSEFIIRNGEYVCKCCGRCYKEKAAEEETRLAIGYESLRGYDFDFAERAFQDIIRDYPDSADARWGLLLAKYGIVFVKGFYMEEIEPIYCFPNYAYAKGSFTSEKEYLEIKKLLSGDAERMYLYEKQAKEIERAFKMFSEDMGKKENDVFICVKISKTTENNPYEKGNTEDYEKACELYGKLRAKGKNVFFSYVTLKNSIDSDMEIWRNMLKSRKMLLIGSRSEYLSSVWVKSEWERWLMLDKADEKAEHRKNLYIYILGKENENLYSKLPAGLKRLKPQIYTRSNEADLINDICGGAKAEAAAKVVKKAAEPIPVTVKPEAIANGEGFITFLDGHREALKLDPKAPIRYSGRADVERVELPEGLEKIEAGFFSACQNLVEIKIPSSVKVIEKGAFSGCSKLASIEIPQSVSTIENDTFYMCKRLASVKLPYGIRSIGERAFMLCESLRSIEIPHSVASIGSEAFFSSGINSVVLPKSVTYIGVRAFGNCNALKKLSLPDTVLSIGEGAFDNKNSLKLLYAGMPQEFEAISPNINVGRCNLVCAKDPKTVAARIKNILALIAAIVIITAAIIIGFTVKFSLPWVISIPIALVVNNICFSIDTDFACAASTLELIACAIMVLFISWSVPVLLIISFAIALGVTVASLCWLYDEIGLAFFLWGTGAMLVPMSIIVWSVLGLAIPMLIIGIIMLIAALCYSVITFG